MKKLLAAVAVMFLCTGHPVLAQTNKTEPAKESAKKDEAKKPAADSDAAKKSTTDKDVAPKPDEADAKKDSKKKVKRGGC